VRANGEAALTPPRRHAAVGWVAADEEAPVAREPFAQTRYFIGRRGAELLDLTGQHVDDEPQLVVVAVLHDWGVGSVTYQLLISERTPDSPLISKSILARDLGAETFETATSIVGS